MQFIEEQNKRFNQGELFDGDSKTAFQGIDTATEPKCTDFSFDAYSSKIVVGSYQHLYSQLLDQQKQLSTQMSSLVRSYIKKFPAANKSSDTKVGEDALVGGS